MIKINNINNNCKNNNNNDNDNNQYVKDNKIFNRLNSDIILNNYNDIAICVSIDDCIEAVTLHKVGNLNFIKDYYENVIQKLISNGFKNFAKNGS